MASLKTCGFVALDRIEYPQAKQLMERLEGNVLGVKFTDILDSHALEALICANYNGLVGWADAKLHDIPTTVASRVHRLAAHGASIITVHPSGGADMVKAARQAYETVRGTDGIGIAAVTLLTSLGEGDCRRLYGHAPEVVVNVLAKEACRGGAHALVCSPSEAHSLKHWFPNLKLLVPGIRSVGTPTNDQVRVGTPAEALQNGADYLVIGREITQAPDPLEAIARIDASIAHLPD